MLSAFVLTLLTVTLIVAVASALRRRPAKPISEEAAYY
jgi:hypothetical protein